MSLGQPVKIVILFLLIAVGIADAQTEYESDSKSKLNSNLAFGVVAPLHPSSQYVNIGWGFTYGVGYNFNHRHSLIAEVLWDRLYPTNEALASIRAALQSNSVDGRADLFSLTANYRLRLSGKRTSTYAITGTGMYGRHVSLSHNVMTGNSITCTPSWLWWGFSCSSGSVVSGQTIGSSNTFAPGVNGGLGVAFALPDSSWKLYVEARYHYAFTSPVTTQMLPITFGVRF